MTVTGAHIYTLTPDTGDNTADGDSSDSQDFVTQQGQGITISGLALGTGTMGIWLIDPVNFPTGVEIGSVNISPANGVWSFTIPSFLNLTNGNYSFVLKNGTGVHGTVLDQQGFTVDNQSIAVAINPIEGGTNVLTAAEAKSGLLVTGTAAGSFDQSLVNGETVQVQIHDSLTNNVLFTQNGAVANGQWSAQFSESQAEALQGNGFDGYYITVSTTDEAGNVGTAAINQFTSTVCFMPGTKVRTPDGEANVETLKRGDLVVTTDGRIAPISWVGRQTVSKIFADPIRVWPIRIKAGALDENVPARDLLLSPDHAILVDGVLVQAGALVNGTSITRESDIPRTFTYYHVELADHSLILAENVPAETFVDNVDRLAFDNWDEHLAIYPDGQLIEEMPYPRAQSFRQVPRATRERLSERGAALFGGDVASSAA